MMVCLLTLLPPSFAGRSYRLDAGLNLVGLVVILAGQGLRFAVVGLAYIHRGGRQGRVWADRLVTGGLFGHCRNPLYVGNILIYLGIFLLYNDLFTYLIGVPVILLMYVSIVATEEAYLKAEFGQEYARYCKRVPRWNIRFQGLRQTVQGMEFRWGRVLVKEYTTVFTWILATLFILSRELILKHEWGMHHWQTIAITTSLGVGVVAWATIRQLKITYRLDKGDY